MGIAMIGLILVALLVLVGLIVGIGLLVKGAGAIRPGHAMLSCPHCSAETPASLENCQKCGRELRWVSLSRLTAMRIHAFCAANGQVR